MCRPEGPDPPSVQSREPASLWPLPPALAAPEGPPDGLPALHPPTGGTGPTSDAGWGCMLRCGQMIFAQALLCRHLGRGEWPQRRVGVVQHRVGYVDGSGHDPRLLTQ